MKKSDKTKEAISQALIELLQRKPLDLITIKEIVEKANIGRTAFYNNFKNKDDVLKHVYRKAHHKTFQDKFKDINYLFSDAYIKDMIHFFDINSQLLLVIYKWNLIDMIAKYNTDMCLEYAKKYDNEFIRKNADYFVCYTGVLIFNMCTLWVFHKKDMTPDELFKMLQYFQALQHNTQ